MKEYLVLVYLGILLLIVIMQFIRPCRRMMARISATCDYPIQKIIAFISAQFDKLKGRIPSFRLAALWYYGVIDGIINLVIFIICRDELAAIFTNWSNGHLISRVFSSFRHLTPLGLILDGAELIDASSYLYSSLHLLSSALSLVLTAIVIDISSYITIYAAEKRAKGRLVTVHFPSKWDTISRFLFAVLYMVSFTLLARKIPTLQIVRILILDVSFLLKLMLILLSLLLICAYFYRVFVPASIAIGIVTIWVFAGLPFINHLDVYMDLTEGLLNLLTVIWFAGMLLWSSFNWNLRYRNARKAQADGSAKSFGAGEKLPARIVLYLIMLYRFEIGDNLRDKLLKQEPSPKKKARSKA